MWIAFVINFVKMLFPGVCFMFMYLFVYVIVRSSDLFANSIMVMDKVADMHW